MMPKKDNKMHLWSMLKNYSAVIKISTGLSRLAPWQLVSLNSLNTIVMRLLFALCDNI